MKGETQSTQQKRLYNNLMGKPDTIFFDFEEKKKLYAHKASVKSYAKYVAGINARPMVLRTHVDKPLIFVECTTAMSKPDEFVVNIKSFGNTLVLTMFHKRN